MITLSAIDHSLDFTMTATAVNAVEFVFAYADVTLTTFTPAGGISSSSTTGPTTLIAAPAASTQRQVKYLSVFNADTVSNTFTWQQNIAGTRRVIRKVTLATLESLVWDGVTWETYTAAGAKKLDSGNVLIPQNLLVPGSQRLFTSALTSVGGTATTTGVGYWSYVGLTQAPMTVKFVEVMVTGAGAGAQTAEIGLFSTPLAPNKAGQSLTKIVATGTVDSLITTGVKRNTASFALAVAAGVHLWAGIRTAMATTQPSVLGLAGDIAQGQYLTAAAPGALTAAGPFTGAIVGADTALSWRVPQLTVTLD